MRALSLLTGLVIALGAFAQSAQERPAERAAMVEVIQAQVRGTSWQLGRETLSGRVLEAMRAVPRHELVPREMRDAAYEDTPLPIGYGQTISQPYIVAIMTDLVDPEPGDKILEIGTGSGYQAAVLAGLVEAVYTIEIIPELARRARGDLARLGYGNVETKEGDGYYGWPAHAPFDGIVVTAGATHVPPPLIEQLKPGGKLVIPVGTRFFTQQLMVLTKAEDGSLTTRQLMPVRFVPLTGGHDRS
jgi:protein-L-isoaspartate(D-aspartate) O-methyltransferase